MLFRSDRSRALLAEANRIYDRYNERWMGRETSIVATEKNAPGSTVCRNPCYLNVVIKEDLPLGFSGRAVITRNRRHYVIGELVQGASSHPHLRCEADRHLTRRREVREGE